jgi:hypothetical protein
MVEAEKDVLLEVLDWGRLGRLVVNDRVRAASACDPTADLNSLSSSAQPNAQ